MSAAEPRRTSTPDRTPPEGQPSATDKDLVGTNSSTADESIALSSAPARAHRHGIGGQRRVTAGTVAVVVTLLTFATTGVAAYFKFRDDTHAATALASVEAVEAARGAAIAMLTYEPDTVEQALTSAQERLTGEFRGEYANLVRDVMIPGAKAHHVSSTAAVTAASVIRAEPTHVLTMLFVNQHATVGDQPPTDTATTVRVALQRIDDEWLVESFEPI